MIKKILESYKKKIEEALEGAIFSFGPQNGLRDAIEYALRNGGKRFRPAITLFVAKAIGKQKEPLDAALAIEFFHTASLIADDLPCMDNDPFRREKPSTHTVFGQATAILATYALISAGYERIRLNAEKENSPMLGMLGFESIAFNTGIFGATGGQFIDLFPPDQSPQIAKEIIDKKTATLFEISFVLGWLFGGGEISSLEEVKKAARHFGIAFQISDDFLDLAEDQGKFNYPALVGLEEARKELDIELSSFKSSLKSLHLESPEISALIHLVEERILRSKLALYDFA